MRNNARFYDLSFPVVEIKIEMCKCDSQKYIDIQNRKMQP